MTLIVINESAFVGGCRYKASDNLWGELGPVCDGHISGAPAYSCVGRWKGKVKMGAPHVVDLGQELEHQPESDGVKRAYMVGHGENMP